MKLLKRLTKVSTQSVLMVACILGLLGLALMFWSIFDPTWIPIMLSMSLGQVIGTLSFGLFILVAVSDLRRSYVSRSLRPDENPDREKP